MKIFQKNTVLGLFAMVGLFLPAAAFAEVKLPAIISDGMVLQRELAAPIWGTAAAGEEVTVTFREQTKKTKAGEDGRWLVRLEPLKAGGPDTLTVAGGNSITVNNVLVGEVWIGSGQSNMAGSVKGYAKGDEVLAKLAEGRYPSLRLANGRGGGWKSADPDSIANFSAIHFAFGLKLHEELAVPVGLIVGAVGGTPSGRWLTDEMRDADEACRKLIAEEQAAGTLEKRLAAYEKALADWPAAVEAAKAAGKPEPAKPMKPAPAGQIAGGRVGDLYDANIKPVVPFGIRGVLWDQGESGTALQGLDQFTVMGALIRGWRTAWEQGEFPFLYVQKPSGGGCAWHSTDPITKNAEPFAELPKAVPAAGEGLYRELHIRIAQHPRTAMVTSTDLGSGVHPTNKSGYGHRAARVALGFAYGRPLAISGPKYASHTIDGDKVRIAFEHVGQGLASQPSDRLQGFQIAGEDRVFHWAEAKIEGDRVVVSSPAVPKPAAVRYAWSNRSNWANLFNQDGLPALTFRTDTW